MSLKPRDDLDPIRLDWPEPLIIDLIATCYGDADLDEPMVAARLHALFLRALIDGETRRSALLRLELIACCAARDIGIETIAAADAAVFREMTTVVLARFRNSPRLLRRHIETLRGALGTLTERGPAPAKAAETTIRESRTQKMRPPLRLGRSLAFTG